jgi:hypothetical protein
LDKSTNRISSPKDNRALWMKFRPLVKLILSQKHKIVSQEHQTEFNEFLLSIFENTAIWEKLESEIFNGIQSSTANEAF